MQFTQEDTKEWYAEAFKRGIIDANEKQDLDIVDDIF